MIEHRTPVLIVGGGMAGLSAAAFLGLHGIRPLLVERHPDTSIAPRAVGQHPRTMEHLYPLGVLDEVRDKPGVHHNRWRIVVGEGFGRREFNSRQPQEDHDVSHLTPVGWGMATQQQIEPILRRRALELGAHLWFSTEMTSFEQDASGVTAVLRDVITGSVQHVRAEYLIAADGHRAGIRRSLGIGMHSVHERWNRILQHSLSIVFDADLSEVLPADEALLYYIKRPDLSGVFVTTETPNRHVLGVESDVELPRERCVELIRSVVNMPDLEPKIVAQQSWEMAAIAADRYRDGRIFLAGDSAHIIPPTGGYGGNTAVGDAAELAWKLAAVIKGEAGDALLDSYEPERLPVAEVLIGQSLRNFVTRMAPQLGEEGLPPETDPVHLIFGFRYSSNAVAQDDGEQVEDTRDGRLAHDPETLRGVTGARAPFLQLGEDESTLDLIGREWLLLAADSRWGVEIPKLQVRLIGTDSTLVDRFTSEYRVERDGAALIRPDGILAWKSVGAVDHPAAALTDVLDRLLARRVTVGAGRQ